MFNIYQNIDWAFHSTTIPNTATDHLKV